MEKPNIIREKTYQFAVDIIHLYKKMQYQKEYVVSRQIVRSGTSIGANVEEATAAQSKKDFVAKMSISSKEARETNYWLRLIRDTSIIDNGDLTDLLKDSEEIIKILTSIIKTAQKNL